MTILVYEMVYKYGGGLVFIDEITSKKDNLDKDKDYKLLGTMEEFVESVEIDLAFSDRIDYSISI